ncbi:MAG: hypothetical protein DRI99_01420 [Candidatus Aminicenantes bacterium]|nr:MAG: hypothetical protein DRI99_01420 [Candidatus Aminicenantes bacterium]
MIRQGERKHELNKLREEINILKKEIAELKESAIRYKTLFESANDAIFVMEDDRFIDCNQKAAEMFGCRREDLIGETPYEKFSPPFQPDGQPSQKKALQKIKAAFKGQPQFFPWTHCRLDGSLFETEVSLSLIEIGAKKSLLAIVRDVSARKRAESALRRAQEHYQELFTQIPIGLYSTTPEGEILDVNPALIDMLGFPDKKSFMKIKSFDVYVDPQERETLKARLEKDGVVYGYQVRFKHRDGRVLWVKLTTRAIRDNEGKIIRYEGAIEDITQQKKSEEALKQSEAFLENVLYSIQDGISVLDPDLTIVMTNQVMEKWYTSNLPLVGKKCFEAYHNRNQPCHPCPSLRCLESGRTEKEIVPGLKGSPVEWIELFSYPLKNPITGKIEGVVEFVRDITPRKKAEELIQKSLKEKEILLQEIHHRVKNNLQIIISLLRLQASSEKDNRLINMFRECQNRIKAMAFVHEKLYQSRDFTRVDFTQYIHDFAQELSTAFGVKKKGIKLKTELEEVELDINRAIPCGLIFNELLTNAIQHAFPEGRAGEIIVRLHWEEQGQISLEVWDSGVGLPADFDLEVPKTLGLMLIKSLTAQINGQLAIGTGEGTSFKIVFPG